MKQKNIGKGPLLPHYFNYALTDTGNFTDSDKLRIFHEVNKYMSYMNNIKSEKH